MEKIWLKQYPATMPVEINADRYSSIIEVFLEACKKYQSIPAFVNMGSVLSYSDLDRLTRNFAAYLVNSLGLKKGDRIAIQMPNCLQYPICLFGALRAGLTVVNTNPLYTPREMEHQFNDAGVRAIVILSNFAKNLDDVLPKTKIEKVIVTDLGDLLFWPKGLIVNFALKKIKKLIPPYSLPGHIKLKDALAEGAALPFEELKISSNEIAFLQYTGGTTGVSKGAMLTHRNMIANMEQISAWIGKDLKDKEEIIITALPLYHIFSLTVNCLAFMKIGASNILITNPKDMNAFVGELKKYPFSVITGVNTLFNGLLHNDNFRSINFKTLKVSVAGGAALQKAVADKWKEVTGVPLVEGYGLTESAPVLCCNPIDGRERIGTIGYPVPSTDVKIIKEDGSEAGVDEAGEVWAKGPQVMAGYWKRPEETAQVLENGWLKTGDMAQYAADGYFKIVDRKKDMILVSGFNVYPNEIEDVVAHHPGVKEVAAIGIPDERSGESVKIFVVRKDPTLTQEAIIKFCRENLTGYKVPRHVEFRDDLPKSNIGKILRRELKEVRH